MVFPDRCEHSLVIGNSGHDLQVPPPIAQLSHALSTLLKILSNKKKQTVFCIKVVVVAENKVSGEKMFLHELKTWKCFMENKKLFFMKEM